MRQKINVRNFYARTNRQETSRDCRICLIIHDCRCRTFLLKHDVYRSFEQSHCNHLYIRSAIVNDMDRANRISEYYNSQVITTVTQYYCLGRNVNLCTMTNLETLSEFRRSPKAMIQFSVIRAIYNSKNTKVFFHHTDYAFCDE